MTQTDAQMVADRSDRRYNALLAIGLVVAGVLIFAVVGLWILVDRSPFPDDSDGNWSATSVIMDGQVIDVELSLIVDGGNGGWQGACNSFTLEGGQVVQSQKGCSGDPAQPNPMEIDARLIDAILEGGELSAAGDELVFDDDGFSVAYERSNP